ncbi:dolichyl-phosphate beta-glucosyltransferase [Drosophila grimshawi]|uniref:Dolichyl-phosphate beta-glucosyltransferase n=1 Tax=Drosophila grimshawi TaxID=7222 RepID=B4JBV7_DROGR|nr:dolichyl-phosphate beta-glucosyltransferase [Drosophila grimshawi]EDW04060.1 GH10179 [Drosophila grimshawi]
MLALLLQLFCYLVAFILATVLLMVLVLLYKTKPYPIITRHKDEKFYLDPKTIKTIEFPSLDEPPTLELSVIVPAYNEEQRLPAMLDECLSFLDEKAARETEFSYEVIIVSDGSSDATVSVALKYSKLHGADKFRVLELVQNRGKGGAVRLGMLSARGRQLLFADADGATKFADYDKLAEALTSLAPEWRHDGIAIGSRAHLEDESIATRSFFRTILMHGFHTLVWIFAVRSVRDTQCGFKLFTRATARKLFNSLHVQRWAFDVELLYLAERLRLPMVEVAVRWTEIDGSKLSPFWSWLQMGIDLFMIWLRYLIGAWRIAASQKKEN